MTFPVNPPARLAGFSASCNPEPLAHMGIRFDAQGRFLKEPGNSVVCHLTEGSASQGAIIALRALYQELPEADKLAFTPVSSLHMTLFQGVIDTRRALPYWPQDLPLDTPIEDVTEIFCQRLKHFRAGPGFRLGLTALTPTAMILEPVDEEDKAALADWRDRLARLFGYRHPDHETYEFHVGFAYVLSRFSDTALCHWEEVLQRETRHFQAKFACLELDPPAFSTFEDMTRFEEVVILD
ncbi:DUF1868 domain-containing protein [Rhizobium paknamense]|uniref:DUF1868 domain-containing protein n=1 Tax=Rhizobium paknamense TaxID=1206817 RepID=A0ABU0I8J3_9HYPH|nr:DUF1868 domain-containing protein [Rhizobium paknamense]MDQ0454548.1 hypothetical protein [Rhizobium paknamense]